MIEKQSPVVGHLMEMLICDESELIEAVTDLQTRIGQAESNNLRVVEQKHEMENVQADLRDQISALQREVLSGQELAVRSSQEQSPSLFTKNLLAQKDIDLQN